MYLSIHCPHNVIYAAVATGYVNFTSVHSALDSQPKAGMPHDYGICNGLANGDVGTDDASLSQSIPQSVSKHVHDVHHPLLVSLALQQSIPYYT